MAIRNKKAMIFLTPVLRGPQTPSAETRSYAYGNATGSPLETHAPDGVGRFHRRAKGMRRGPRAVRLRVISNGGVAPKPPCQQLLAWGLGGDAPILESSSRPTERGANVWSICC